MNLTTLLAVALPLSAPFLGALYKYLISSLPAVKQAQLTAVIQSSVNAAEQVYANIPASGSAKREWVLSRLQAIFGKRVNAALVEVLLEDAVKALPHLSPPRSI